MPPDIYLRSVPSDPDSDDVRLRDPTQPDSITGDLTVTAAQTLAAVTQSADLDVIISAAAAQALAHVTQDGTLDVEDGVLSLTASQALADVSQAANASAGVPPVIVGGGMSRWIGDHRAPPTARPPVEIVAHQQLGGVSQRALAVVLDDDEAEIEMLLMSLAA
jgi:hypothetical protein